MLLQAGVSPEWCCTCTPSHGEHNGPYSDLDEAFVLAFLSGAVTDSSQVMCAFSCCSDSERTCVAVKCLCRAIRLHTFVWCRIRVLLCVRLVWFLVGAFAAAVWAVLRWPVIGPGFPVSATVCTPPDAGGCPHLVLPTMTCDHDRGIPWLVRPFCPVHFPGAGGSVASSTDRVFCS